MGADAAPHPEDGEGPQRSILLDPYEVSVAAVSVAEFDAFASDTGYVTLAENLGMSHVFKGQLTKPDNHPIAAPLAPWWRVVLGACWRLPNGETPARDEDPVVHVSLRDALAFCHWRLEYSDSPLLSLQAVHSLRVSSSLQGLYS